jgi:hypothetical protein
MDNIKRIENKQAKKSNILMANYNDVQEVKLFVLKKGLNRFKT